MISIVGAEPSHRKEDKPVTRTQTLLSPVYTVDRPYKSMQGPSSQQKLVLGQGSGLVWITAFQAQMVGADGESPVSQEFMCHSNLDIDPHARRVRGFVGSQGLNSRLFTLSQGQFEVRLPPGFGIPVLADEELSIMTQVLNLNWKGQRIRVRHKLTVEYIEDRDAGEMTPLFSVGAYGLALLEGKDGYFGLDEANQEEHGASCLPGKNAAQHVYQDHQGRTFTGHWVVEPGREVKRTLVTQLMNLPYDTTVHAIAVHLHPFAESLELVDLTTGESLFKSDALNFKDKIGLDFVSAYSDTEGFKVYKDHQYQLISTYENTSGESQDSMAVMNLYLRDQTGLATIRAGAAAAP